MSERTFEDKPAVRERVPLLVGLFGPSGSGKTYSALRLATGMQRVTGGNIYVIDTESRRALHYADDFTFQHLQFDAPFSPLDYLAAIEHCTQKGASIIIVDSMSHEHEGPGGVLEWADREGGNDPAKNFTKWVKPKQARRKLINTLLQLGVNAIFCFRAKEKIKPQKGRDDKGKSKPPIPLGWMPIAGEEFLYEQTVNCLLYPASGGVPTWDTSEIGEKTMLKLPAQFTHIFAEKQPLSEDIGQALAEWASGDAKAPAADETADVINAINAAQNSERLKQIAQSNKDRDWTAAQRKTIKRAIDARKAALAAELEVDPDTGEVIPPEVGRDPREE